jgi:hypothetical protein
MCLPALSRIDLLDPPHTFRISSHFASVSVVVAAAAAAVARWDLLLIGRVRPCGPGAHGRCRRTVHLARRSAASRGRCCEGRRLRTAAVAVEHPGPPCKARHWLVCPCPIAPVEATLVNPSRGCAVVSCRNRGQTARVTVDNRATSNSRQGAKHRRPQNYCAWDHVQSNVAQGRLRGVLGGGDAAMDGRLLVRR